jgi:chemotaxis protein methyltransferase CheR
MVRFARINLAEPSYPAITNGTSMIDIILCRNVTIYFDELTTRQVAEQFYQALAPGGWLVVGHSEPQATIYHQFEVHNFPNTILYRKPLDTLLFPLGPKYQGFETNLHMVPNVQPAIPQEPSVERHAQLRQTSPLKHQQVDVDITHSRQPLSSSVPNTWAIIAARLAQDDKPTAETLLRELLDADPTHVQAHITLGRLYADRADWTCAQQQCQFVLEQEPLSIPAHYLLAQICEHQGQLDAALAAYRRTVYLDHSFIAGMLGMANIWRRMGHPANAQRYYHNSLKLLRKLPPTSTLPESDGATASDMITLVMRQLEAVAAR